MFSIKRIIFIILLWLPLESYALNFGVAPKGGIGLSHMTYIDTSVSSFAYLFGAGAYAHLTDRWVLEADLLYQSKGTRGKKLEYSIQYLSIPLKGSYRVIEHISIFAGSQLSLLLNASANNVDVTSSAESTAFDLVFGFNYYFPIRDYRLVFEFLVEVGLTDMTKSNFYYTQESNSNRAFYFTVGWEFLL